MYLIIHTQPGLLLKYQFVNGTEQYYILFIYSMSIKIFIFNVYYECSYTLQDKVLLYVFHTSLIFYVTANLFTFLPNHKRQVPVVYLLNRQLQI